MPFDPDSRPRYRWIESARRWTREPPARLEHTAEHWHEEARTNQHRAVALGILAVLAGGADLLGLLSRPFLLELIIFAAAVAAYFANRWHAARWRRETALDDLILLGSDEPAEARARRSSLIAPERRRSLARSLRRLVGACGRRPLEASRTTIANVLAVRRHRRDLEHIADLLEGPQPVRCEGVILLSRLLRDGMGPLYGSSPTRDRDELGEALELVESSLGAGASA